jgi:UDP-N-acetylmuramoyl-L-alanyl-D-glutamate--2,6-diaminopimelate ligase
MNTHQLLQYIKRYIPNFILLVLRPPYHHFMAFAGACAYHFPSRKLHVIAVTGTNGKSSVVEMMTHILRTAGHRTASISTMRFTVGDDQTANRYKMTTPGRFFVQKFLRQAVSADCTHAVVEMTSEGAVQSRHRYIAFDALVFTNLTPEHIESHGSFENYKNAKLLIARAVTTSPKRPRTIVANTDDAHGADFLLPAIEHPLGYSLSDLSSYTLHSDHITLTIDKMEIRVPVAGLFSVYNALAVIRYARAIDITLPTLQKAFATLPTIHGRVEQFHSPTTADKQVTVVVDYAHTPDSLEQLYQTFAGASPARSLIGVLGNTGGGRDTWKRPAMGALAEQYCDQVIFTNEDPYDEDPAAILHAMQAGTKNPAGIHIILDRREAIKTAIATAPNNAVVLITGKGTDPFIMGPNGSKEPWDDATVVKEVLSEQFGGYQS